MRKKINPHNLNAVDIRKAMMKRWTSPEWAIMWEVADTTGYAASRSADAVMMGLWPSRGLELHGVEIKISRADWKREARDPTKAESIAKYCDRWWIHTPVGVVDDLSDLPPAWGLREFTGKQWKTIRDADKTDANPIERGFLAALLRRSDETSREFALGSIEDERKKLLLELEKSRSQISGAIDKGIERRTHDYIRLNEQVCNFEEITGIPLERYSNDLPQIARCAVHLSHAVKSDYLGLVQHAERLEGAAKALRELYEITRPVEEAG